MRPEGPADERLMSMLLKNVTCCQQIITLYWLLQCRRETKDLFCVDVFVDVVLVKYDDRLRNVDNRYILGGVRERIRSCMPPRSRTLSQFPSSER